MRVDSSARSSSQAPSYWWKLAAVMSRFFEATGWTPTIRKIVAGALPYTRYNLSSDG